MGIAMPDRHAIQCAPRVTFPSECDGRYTAYAIEVLPSSGISLELFLTAAMFHRPRQLYEFGPFVLNPVERTLLREGNPVSLQPKVFDTLLVLVERGGHLVEKGEFMRAVWPEDEFVEEQNLNKNISKLRQALGAGGAKYIETVPKSGYRFAAEVRRVDGDEVSELVAETRTRASPVIEEEMRGEVALADRRAGAAEVAATGRAGRAVAAPNLAATRTRRLGRWAAAAASGVLVLAAVAYVLYQPREAGMIDSVAVLPFVNAGGDPEIEYLSDGVSESLIGLLSRLPKLKVIARSSSFRYKGREVDPRDAGRAMGVAAVLTGRVERRGDALFIGVELVDARDNTHIWGEQYNRKASDLLAVQDDISREIADKLRLHLSAGERQQLARRETVNPLSYELLLRARLYRSRGTTKDRMKAVEYLRQATDVDPAYAPAYAELSLLYGGLVNNLLLNPKEYLPEAEKTARRALELDEGLAEAHLAMAHVKENAWDWASAEREYRRAIELKPNLANAHVGYVYHLIIRGRDDEALAEARRAKELDPLSPSANQAIVHGMILAGQTEQAIDVTKKMLELDKGNPNAHWLLAVIYQRAEQYPEAIAAYKEAIRLGDTSADIEVALGAAYAKAGRPEQARAILKRLETGDGYISPVGLAIVYAALGERERALALLERACASHDQQLMWVSVERRFAFASLQADQRFNDITRCVGLAQ